jgi:hypothetical protein
MSALRFYAMTATLFRAAGAIKRTNAYDRTLGYKKHAA